MSHSLSSFITAFNGGLRANRFSVVVPSAGDMTFHCRAASLPAVTTSVISVPYRGRVYKIPGQRTFATWSVVVLDDVAVSQGGASSAKVIWDKLMDWSNSIQSNIANTTNADNDDMENLMETITVNQLNFNGGIEKQVRLIKAWPAVVGQIEFSQDNPESLCSFNVDFEFQYVDGPPFSPAPAGGG